MQFSHEDFITADNPQEIVIDCNTIVANSESYKETALPKCLEKIGDYNTASRLSTILLQALLDPIFRSSHLQDYSLKVSDGVIQLTVPASALEESYINYLAWYMVDCLNCNKPFSIY